MTSIRTASNDGDQSISLTTLVGITILVSFGAVVLLLSLFYVQDVRTLRDLPDSLWSFICGVPQESGATLPLLIMVSVLSFISAGLLYAWSRLSRKRTILLMTAGAAVILLTGLVTLRSLQAALDASTTDVSATTDVANGVHFLEQPRLLSDFTLLSSTGASLSLSDLEGKPTLLFFGYLHCPDFCPTTLALLKQAFYELGDEAERVQVLFISVDDARDQPSDLRTYLDRFDPSFIGMQGESTALAQITPDYGLSYRLETPDVDGNYAVEHSVQLYLIDERRQLRAIIDYGTEAADIVEAIRAVWTPS